MITFMVASFLTAYPDRKTTELIDTLLENGDCIEQCKNIDGENWKKLSKYYLGNKQNLESRYIDLFDRGNSASPYETAYGLNRSFTKGSELADIEGFYKAFALKRNDAHKDMPDHVSVEFEFYAILHGKREHLISKEDTAGADIVNQAMKSFLQDHLSQTVRSICDSSRVKNDDYYSVLYAWCDSMIKSECDHFGIAAKSRPMGEKNYDHASFCCGDVG